MNFPYTIVIQWSDEDRCYLVHLPEFPTQQFHTHGDTYQEALNNAQEVLGQYILYRNLLKLNNQNYEIYLAVRDSIFDTFFQRKSIQAVVKLNKIALIVFNNEKEEIVEWIS